MGSLLLMLAWLQAPAVGAFPMPLVRSIELDDGILLSTPSLLATDTMALRVEAGRVADFKLSEQDEVLAAGRLLPGGNSLRFRRPGLSDRSQALTFLFELLENGEITRKTIRVIVTVEGGTDADPSTLSGSFTLEMHHAGRVIGFRRKKMTELLKMKSGPAMPVEDPGLSGSAIRSRPESHSVSLIGLGMALAKHLARKKAEKRLMARNAETLKKKLTVNIIRRQQEVPITIELRID